LNDVSTEQVLRAIHEFLLPSDKAFLEGMELSRARGRKLQRQAIAPAAKIPDSNEDEELPNAGAPRPNRAEKFVGESRLKNADLITH